MAVPSGPVAEPLIRVRGWRGFVALGMVLSCALAALVGTVWLLVLMVPVGLGVAAGATWAVSGVLAAWAVDTGRWRPGPLGYVQRLAAAVLFAGAAALVVAGFVRGVGLLLELPDYGTPPSAAAPSFGVAAVGALALAVLAASAPLTSGGTSVARARLRRATVGAAALGAIAAIGALVAASAPAGCGTFDFEPERWRSELAGEGSARLVRMGEAVKRCGIVEPGMTPAQVRAKLGPLPSNIAGTYVWWLGQRGLISQQMSLNIGFERSDGTPRVADVMLHAD
jgi:hypothetical protein